MPAVRIEKIGPYELRHPDGFPSITEDPYHLVDFLLKSPSVEQARSIMDIGASTGVIPLLLASRSNIEQIRAVEIDVETANEAKENIERNGLAERVEIINSDYRELDKIFESGSFDIIVSNPPYIKAGQGRESAIEKRNIARSEKFGSLKELVNLSATLLSKAGRLFLIFPLLRKVELLNELASNGLRVLREELVRGKGSGKERLFMVEAGRGEIFNL